MGPNTSRTARIEPVRSASGGPTLGRLIRRPRSWAMVVLGASAALAATAAPALAYASPVDAGWYGSAPLSGAQCTAEYQLAVGGDGQPMKAQICVSQTNSNQAQGYVRFHNYSTSTATATATVQIWAVDSSDNVHKGSTWTCGGKTLTAKGNLYCTSYNTAYFGIGNLRATAYGQPRVNGYGGNDNSGWVSLTS